MESSRIENQETRFNSPYPFLIRLRNALFSEEKPDGYTQATFYLNLILWSIFFIWSIASFLAISFRQLIFEEKGIPVELIIKSRGVALGFNEDDFLQRLLTFHSMSIVCWLFVFVGLVLLWRKKLNFVFFFFGGTVFYFGMLIFYLNWDYFKNDTTFFDKIIFLAMNANALMYYFLLRKESNDGSLSFFGEDEDDE